MVKTVSRQGRSTGRSTVTGSAGRAEEVGRDRKAVWAVWIARVTQRNGNAGSAAAAYSRDGALMVEFLRAAGGIALLLFLR